MLTVRTAAIADLDALSELCESTYRSHFAAIWSSARLEAYIAAEYARAVLEPSLGDPGALWLLAELEGRPIGFAKVNWNRPLPKGTGSGAELQKIYLRAERTGQGYGGALLGAVIERVRAGGEGLLWLYVLKSNTGARALYERHGFTTVGETPFATDLRESGRWLMARDL